MDSDHERASRAHAWDRLFRHLALQRGCAAGEHGVAARVPIELRVGNDLPHQDASSRRPTYRWIGASEKKGDVMGWTKIALARVDNIEAKAFRLKTQFDAMFITALTPAGAAMFQDHNMEHGCTFYFSPKATQLFSPFLRSVAITPINCEAPARESVSLLIGDATAWDLLPNADKSGK